MMINTLLCFICVFRIDGIELSSDGSLGNKCPTSYCGIYAAYGAAQSVHRKQERTLHFRFEELLTPNFVSRRDGSTQFDLERAIQRLGCKSKTFYLLSLRSLELSKTPLLLHVSSRGQHGLFRHWILFLGINEGKATVRDGGGGDIQMDTSELLSRWGGTAIAVFGETDETPRFYSWELLSICVLLTGVAFICSVFSKAFTSKGLINNFLTFTLAGGVCVSYIALSNPQAVVSVNNKHAIALGTEATRIPEIDLSKMQEVYLDASVTLIDCRYEDDFIKGTIDGAISLPVDLPIAKLVNKTQVLDRDTQLVVFCQSKGCKFSDLISVELVRIGFTKIYIYRNGYAEWAASKE